MINTSSIQDINRNEHKVKPHKHKSQHVPVRNDVRKSIEKLQIPSNL